MTPSLPLPTTEAVTPLIIGFRVAEATAFMNRNPSVRENAHRFLKNARCIATLIEKKKPTTALGMLEDMNADPERPSSPSWQETFDTLHAYIRQEIATLRQQKQDILRFGGALAV